MRRSVPFLPLLCLLVLLARPAWAESYEDGVKALDAGKPNEALAIWTALAGKGDASAKYGLGRLYEVGGHGFTPDKARAADWYRQAADAGVIAAQNNLALLYAKGEGVPRDLAMAAKLWEQAAVRGHPTAQYNLGLLHLRGEGVERDDAQGAAWIHKAAEAGVPAAQFVMGDLRRYGIGVAQDPGLALDWYERAAAGGYAPARREAERLQAGGVLAKRGPPAETAAVPMPAAKVPAGKPPARPPAPPAAKPGGAGIAAAPPAAVPPAHAGKPAAARLHDAGPAPSPSPPSPQLPALAENDGPLTSEELFFQRTDGAGAAPPPASDEARPPGTQADAARAAAAGTDAAGAVTAESPAAPEPGPLPSPPKPADLQVVTAEPVAAAPPEAPPPAAPAPAPLSGRFALWLGTAGSEAAADRLGRAVAERHRDALGTLAVTVRRVEVAGLGAVYRVFAGDWAERAEAERACDRLRVAEPATFCAAVAY
ncbi:TPR repeat [Tistlia consotensis]|uniref:TPR repeat n=1 Tax=Tistlia consotensis USBA 355 TaxID=560819 RepID=A0A1Y6BS59_9PROT|nr:SPOR domain-containing protein [Tistlia consotensis]SMF24409.1 TPR repeat [Tistlia consotensis USBA 355]SNR60556.1 TPR repeat [Tistlia consotensis]